MIAALQAALARAVTRPWPGGDDPALAGFDARGLALLARLTVAKRLEKIALALPVTARLLADRLDAVGAAFAAACPPSDPTRLAGAAAFVAFLEARPPEGVPPWLIDTARFEHAFLRARLHGDDAPAAMATGVRVRRRRAAVLCALDWDVRPLFVADVPQAGIERVPLRLAFVGHAAAATPRLYALAPAVFDLVAALDDWQEVGSLPADALEALARRGILEVG